MSDGWFYSDVVKEHFFYPKNFCKSDEEIKDFDAHGTAGSPACGDRMDFWIKVKDDKIIDVKWRTFGCGSAIASTSILSVMITENGGMLLDDALKIRPKDIVDKLGGLPLNKIHCSVLGDKTLRAAINAFFRKTGQENRIVNE